MVGQEKSPLSLENRTSDNATTFLERSIAIRGFVNPNIRDIGITLWGDIGENTFIGYEGGMYLGDGSNRPQVDARPDFVGRVFVRPFAANKASPLQHAQVGLSGRVAVRDAAQVAYDYNPITDRTRLRRLEPDLQGFAGAHGPHHPVEHPAGRWRRTAAPRLALRALGRGLLREQRHARSARWISRDEHRATGRLERRGVVREFRPSGRGANRSFPAIPASCARSTSTSTSNPKNRRRPSRLRRWFQGSTRRTTVRRAKASTTRTPPERPVDRATRSTCFRSAVGRRTGTRRTSG